MDIELKELTKDDIELVRTWRNSPEVAAYMYTEEKISSEQQAAWFEKIKSDKKVKYWIINYDNKKVGLASLTDINLNLGSCYWAFYLGETTARGSGIGAKTEYNVMTYVFDELKLNKLRCEVFAFNDKVIKMHERMGFKQEAYYREHCKKNGKYEDVIGLAILRSEWETNKETIKISVYQRS